MSDKKTKAERYEDLVLRVEDLIFGLQVLKDEIIDSRQPFDGGESLPLTSIEAGLCGGYVRDAQLALTSIVGMVTLAARR